MEEEEEKGGEDSGPTYRAGYPTCRATHWDRGIGTRSRTMEFQKKKKKTTRRRRKYH